MSESKLFATFIGINAYQYNPLSGCIKDVLDIDLLLRDQCAQQTTNKVEYKPLYLLAPSKTDLLRIGEHEKIIKDPLKHELPTFDAVSKKAFQHFKDAGDGDTCIFYYSGHGSQTEAPEVFWHSKPDRMNETIVCFDSRDPAKPDARDLIDKELAYLIWDALDKKNLHCLVIMDCCHSGNNMRNLDNAPVNYRFIPSSRNKIPLEKYIGYDNPGFYEIKDNKASIKVARYVHFAACRDAEKAQESAGGGLFTSKLTEVLRSGGTARSYRDLSETLTVYIRNRAEQQNPVVFARDNEDLDLRFLGGALIPYQPSFEVNYDHARKKWILYGGTMHGLVPSDLHAKTSVHIKYARGQEEKEMDVEIKEVFPTFSFADVPGNSLDQEKNYKAFLSTLANPVLKIGLSQGLARDQRMLDELKAAYESERHLYFKINFADMLDVEYLMQVDIENNYLFTRIKSDVPLFKREKNAASFLRNIDSVGKWISASELKNSTDKFSASDFIFTFEKIEGVDLRNVGLQNAKGEETVIQPGDELVLSYKGSLQPAFALSISINPKSAIASCYVGALYLESKFGIVHDLIPEDSNRLVRDTGVAARLVFFSGANQFTRIPVNIDKSYELYGINEITEFLKIFVADKPFKLDRFKQVGLKLDMQPNLQVREIGIEEIRGNDNLGDDTAWSIFTNKMRIVKDNKEKDLLPGTEVDFIAFKVKVPDTLTAKAYALTGDDIQKKLKSPATRGLNEDEKIPLSLLTPPPHLWGDATTADTPFAKGLNSASDNGIQVLELVLENENESIVLPEGQSLLITPKQLPATRSADDYEEMVIPYGFDESSQLYIPLGYSDETGTIHVDYLPAPTPGRISGEQPLTRSLGGSIKLFFKKIFHYRDQETINKLVLYRLDQSNNWERLDINPSAMKAELSTKPGSKSVLFVHGIIGDTKGMLQSFKAMNELKATTSFLLTYDYENLATPVKDTAKKLLGDLTDAGFDESNMPELIVVAHSMGGLVMRWLIEKERKPLQLKHLILAGTPGAGSEIADFGSSLFNLLTHAINVTGPLKFLVTGLSFLIKKMKLDPKRTLGDMNIDAGFIKEINQNAVRPGGIDYNIICGDTSLIAKNYKGNDFFLKKISAALLKVVVYPGLNLFIYKDKPNDMAVTIESMKRVPAFDESQVHLVASDHISYFEEKPSLDILHSLVK